MNEPQHPILQQEFQYYSKNYSKNHSKNFEDFKIYYDNFKGPLFNEFLGMTDTIYKEWTHYRYHYHNKPKNPTFSQIWTDFKNYWQYDSEETQKVFEEMKLLSEEMLREWRIKYTFEYPHVYEKDQDYHTYSKKSKAVLWEEFKEVWDIDIQNYNEERYNLILNYINKIESEDFDNFYEYRENANYHSYNSYSILEKCEICEDFENFTYT